MRQPPPGFRFKHPYRDAAAAGPKCPCDAHPLEPVDHASGQSFLGCPACFGSWIDADVLRAVIDWSVANTASDSDGDEPRLARVYAMGRQKHRDGLCCPACGAEMIAEEHKRDSFILVDICPSGCGKWLDDDELRRLIAYSRVRFR